MTTWAILPRSSHENSFAHARHKTEAQNASTASSVFASNYGLTRSFQSLTVSGCWFACVQTFCSLKALFTEKPISNSCRVISAQSFGAGGLGGFTHWFLQHSVKLTLNTIWHKQQNRQLPPKWLGSILHVGGWAGGRGRLLATKEFFLLRPRAPTLRLVGLRGHSGCS